MSKYTPYVCPLIHRIPCGILKSRRSSRRASAIASARQIRICIWDGLGFDDEDDGDDDNEGDPTVRVGVESEPSAPPSDLPLLEVSIDDSCWSSSSNSCPESGEGLSGSISVEAILCVALLDSFTSATPVSSSSSSSSSETNSETWSRLDDEFVSSNNAATSKDSLTSHIAAIILSISTVIIEVLPSASLIVVSILRSSVPLLVPSESSCLLLGWAWLAERQVTPSRAATLRAFLMMVVSLYPRSVPWVVKTLFSGLSQRGVL